MCQVVGKSFPDSVGGVKSQGLQRARVAEYLLVAQPVAGVLVKQPALAVYVRLQVVKL